MIRISLTRLSQIFDFFNFFYILKTLFNIFEITEKIDSAIVILLLCAAYQVPGSYYTVGKKKKFGKTKKTQLGSHMTKVITMTLKLKKIIA